MLPYQPSVPLKVHHCSQSPETNIAGFFHSANLMCTCAHMSCLLGCMHAPEIHSPASKFLLQKAGNLEGGLSQSTGPGYLPPLPPATAGLTGREADREGIGGLSADDFFVLQGGRRWRVGKDLWCTCKMTLHLQCSGDSETHTFCMTHTSLEDRMLCAHPSSSGILEVLSLPQVLGRDKASVSHPLPQESYV